MNKKAVITYIVALVFVILGALYVGYTIPGHSNALATAASTTITATVSGNASSPSGQNNLTFNSTRLYAGSSCASGQDYSCLGASLSASTGLLTAEFRQFTGLEWRRARVFLLNRSQIANVRNYPAYSSLGVQLYNVTAGEKATILIRAIGANSLPGTQFYGQLWSAYSVPGNDTVYYGRIANVSVNAS